MSTVLLDGEGLYNASMMLRMMKCRKLEGTELDTLMNLINGIVLWDEICVMEQTFNSRWKSGVGLLIDYGVPFHDLHKLSINRALERMELDHFFKYEERKGVVDKLKPDKNGHFKAVDVLAALTKDKRVYYINDEGKRALDYLLLANVNRVDYLPSIKRQEILESYNYMSFFQRPDIINKVDKQLLNYYASVNEYIGKSRLNFELPIMLDYLLEKYSSGHDIIQAALELKTNDHVIAFRKEMNELKEASTSGDINTIKWYYANIEHIIGKFSEELNTQRKLSITLGVTPSIEFDVNVPKPKKFQCLFLKDLAQYGIKERAKTLTPNCRLLFKEDRYGTIGFPDIY